MGPDRASFDSESAYRLRYASYSARWLLALGAGLLLMVAIRPWSGSAPALFILFFLYLLFGLGTLAAFLASAAFLVGGLWSRWLEKDARRDRIWSRSKQYAYAGLALMALLFAYGCVAYGFLFGTTFFPSRRGVLVSYAEHGFWFVVAMAFWLWGCTSGARYTLRLFRKAMGR